MSRRGAGSRLRSDPGTRRGLPALVTLLFVWAVLGAGAPALAAPRLELRPPRLTFDPRGESRELRLRNAGDAPLQLKALSFSADSAGFAAEQLTPRRLAPGEELAVTVRYVRSGARPQAFGALLVYSDDPGGFDDPRSAERDFARGAALVAGETTTTLWLWLPPLGAAVLLLARRRAGPVGRVLRWAGALLPLAASLWLVERFDAEFAVPQGNYGIQLGLHRALWPAAGLELWTGVDGLALPLVLLLAAAAALQLLGRDAAGTAGCQDAGPVWTLIMYAGALLVLCSLDAVSLLCGWELALLGAWRRLAGLGGRGELAAHGGAVSVRTWFGGAQVGAALLGVGMLVVRAGSLPTALVDGTTVAHTTDLVKLSYANYFGDLAWKGVALDRLLWAALTVGALLPVGLLAAVRAPLRERLSLSLPLLVLGAYAVIRLAFYVLPQATAALAPWLIAAALGWGLAFTLRALRQRQLPQLLTAAAAARASGVFVGLLSATQTGAQAGLLQLWHHGLATLLLVMAARLGEAGSGRAQRASLGIAALLILDAPGMLGFVQRTLLVLGAFPELRLAAAGVAAMGLLVSLAALQRALAKRPPERTVPDAGPGRLTLLPLAGLTAAALLLGVYTQPLLGLSRGFVSDFVSHVFTHLDGSAIAAVIRP